MGRDFGSLQNPEAELAVVYKTVLSPPPYVRLLQVANLFLPGWLINNLPLKRNTDVRIAQNTIRQTCRDLIEEKKIKMKKSERTEVDIIGVALESGNFSEENLVNQMMTL